MKTHDELFDCITHGLVELKKAHAMIQRMLVAASKNPKLSIAAAEIQNTIQIIDQNVYEKNTLLNLSKNRL